MGGLCRNHCAVTSSERLSIFMLFARPLFVFYPGCLAELPTLQHHGKSAHDPSAALAYALPFHYPRAFTHACFMDHLTRFAMKAANGSIFMSMLARSRAAKYASRSSTRITVHG
jgi:hypothetical protein